MASIYGWIVTAPDDIRDILDQLAGIPNLVWEDEGKPSKKGDTGAGRPKPREKPTPGDYLVVTHHHGGAKDTDNKSTDDTDPPKGGNVR